MPGNIFMPTYDIISYLWAKRDIHSCAVGETAKEEGADEGKEKGKGMVCDRQQLWQDADGGLSPCDYHNYKYRLLLLAGECLKLPSQTAPTAPHPHTHTLELDIRVTPSHTHVCTHTDTHTHTCTPQWEAT